MGQSLSSRRCTILYDTRSSNYRCTSVSTVRPIAVWRWVHRTCCLIFHTRSRCRSSRCERDCWTQHEDRQMACNYIPHSGCHFYSSITSQRVWFRNSDLIIYWTVTYEPRCITNLIYHAKCVSRHDGRLRYVTINCGRATGIN